MTPANLNWQPYYGNQVQPETAGRIEAAVVHACIWPNDLKATPIDMTSLVKRVYMTPGGVPGTMETVVQFTEQVDSNLFGNDEHRVVFTVTALILDHVGKLAVVREFSYQPNTYLRVPTELVGTPLAHQFQIDYQLADGIRELARPKVQADE